MEKSQILKDVESNQCLNIQYNPDQTSTLTLTLQNIKKPFTDISTAMDLYYLHQENASIDFYVQPLIPHELSRNGPAIAVGDINGNGLDDFIIGGAGGYPAHIFIQNHDSSFKKIPFPYDKKAEDLGILLFDADGDQDLDLYMVSGGTSLYYEDVITQDRIYYNDGTGKFTPKPDALPEITGSGSCVVASDYDRDGDLDLFVGGRVKSGKYPLRPNSYLLQNEGGKFYDITNQVKGGLSLIGMVTSAIWTDYNNDQWIDLLIVGEWMPITLFENQKGVLFRVDHQDLRNTEGWWNSMISADFDNDGDPDYVLGNLGKNTNYRASPEKPFSIYAKDFDQNGSIDPIMCQYYGDLNYPVPMRDALIQQIAPFKKRFNNYESYASKTFNEAFTKEELQDAFILKCHMFESVYLENKEGSFSITPLPISCQVAPIFGMVTLDYDLDGNTDILLSGNSYSTEVGIGRYDAFTGLVLKGTGQGAFKLIKSTESGFLVDGDAKSLTSLFLSNQDQLILAGQNRGVIRLFSINREQQGYILKQNSLEAFAIANYKNGSFQKIEFSYGSGYLSQSPRKVVLSESVSSVEVFDYQGNLRRQKEYVLTEE